MRLRTAALAVVLALSLGLVLYGLAVGPQATYSVDVESTVAEQSLANETEPAEYDSLAPPVQKAFRESLRTGERVSVAESPGIGSTVVHYREEYYSVAVITGDGAQTTMATSILAGLFLALLGTVGWYSRLRGAAE